MKTHRIVLVLFAVIGIVSSLPSRTRAQAVIAPGTGTSVHGVVAAAFQGKPLVVRVHADWCAECQTTLPDFHAFAAMYPRKINILDLDVTGGKTLAKAVALAQNAGIGAYYELTKTKPLTVAFIDPKSNTIIAELRGNVDLNDLITAERAVERSMRSR